MAQVKSMRSQKLITESRFFTAVPDSRMRKFPSELPQLWLNLEWDGEIVKKMSFSGQLSPEELVLLESMASLLIGKPMRRLDDLSFRECEAYLRDRNSEPAFSGTTEKEEVFFKKVTQWVRIWPRSEISEKYSFPSGKAPFHQLKLVEKIRELKAFLNSSEILALYQGVCHPELIDVEELTVYIQVPYDSKEEKILFEKLHLLGVEVFGEENLNFIPEVP
jgi:hypothetical protein